MSARRLTVMGVVLIGCALLVRIINPTIPSGSAQARHSSVKATNRQGNTMHRLIFATAAVLTAAAALTGCSAATTPAASPSTPGATKAAANSSAPDPTPSATETAVADPEAAATSTPAATPSVSALAQHIYDQCNTDAAENGVTLTYTDDPHGYITADGSYQLIYPFTFNDGHTDPYAIYNCGLTNESITSTYVGGGLGDSH